MNKAYLALAILLVGSLFWIGLSLSKQEKINAEMFAMQKKIQTIEEQKHIDNLYTIYQENMSGCKKEALAQNKKDDYIKENCINVINESIIAKWLKEWGYNDLIKSE